MNVLSDLAASWSITAIEVCKADSIGRRNISILEVLHGTITWLGR